MPPQTASPAATPKATPYTVSSFASSLRTKYPNGVASDGTPYSKMSDDDLTQRVVTKYPVYASQIQGYKSPAPVAKTPAENPIVSDVKDAGSKVEGDMSDTSTNPLEKGVRAASDVATGVTDVAADAIPAGKEALDTISNVTGAGIDAAGNIGNTLADLSQKLHLMSPEQREAYDKANSEFANSESGKTVTRIATDLAAAGNVAGTILGAGEGAGAVDSTISKVKEVAPAIKDTVVTAVKGTPEAQAAATAKAQAAIKASNTAAGIKDATPDYDSMTPTQKAKLRTQPAVDGTPRVVENPNMTGKRTTTPTKSEIEAGTELANVKGYSPSMTNLEKSNLAQSEITTRAKALRTALGKEKILVPPKEALGVVTRAINKIPDTSILVSKADPVIRNYTRVVRNAIAKAPGTMEGMLDVRQAMDSAYNNARGGLAYGSDKLASIDEIHRAGRDALNKYITDKAKNTPYEASLKGQTNLYRALDEVGDRADREAGSAVGRFVQNHPVVAGLAKAGVKAAGFGAGLHLIP